MRSILRPLRHLIAPVAAAVFVGLWMVAEAGRYVSPEQIVTLLLFGTAVGISRALPRIALAVVAATGAIRCLSGRRILRIPSR
jgi:hypothetical protein